MASQKFRVSFAFMFSFCFALGGLAAGLFDIVHLFADVALDESQVF